MFTTVVPSIMLTSTLGLGELPCEETRSYLTLCQFSAYSFVTMMVGCLVIMHKELISRNQNLENRLALSKGLPSDVCSLVEKSQVQTEESKNLC